MKNLDKEWLRNHLNTDMFFVSQDSTPCIQHSQFWLVVGNFADISRAERILGSSAVLDENGSYRVRVKNMAELVSSIPPSVDDLGFRISNDPAYQAVLAEGR